MYLFHTSAAPRGGGGGGGRRGQLNCPPMIFDCFVGFFACQLSGRSCPCMMTIIPLTHYEYFFFFFFFFFFGGGGGIFEVGENSRIPSPPPPPSDFFRAGAAVARHFALPKQTPWRRPCFHITTNRFLVKVNRKDYGSTHGIFRSRGASLPIMSLIRRNTLVCFSTPTQPLGLFIGAMKRNVSCISKQMYPHA